MLTILPLGGMGNVTKNMFVYEQDGKILIVDCGIGFPDENMPGIDLLIPDTSYLVGRKNDIVGMILTHGHDDHIAGLPYVLPLIGDPPTGGFPIFASKLTAAFAETRMRDFRIGKVINILDDNSPLTLGPFVIHSIKVTHSVPDARHLVIETKEGVVYHGADFKFDLTPVDNVRPEFGKIAAWGAKGILAVLSDSLRSEVSGYSLSESMLTETFEREIRGTRGRFIVTTMSSNVHRIQTAVNVAVGHNRKVAFFGRSVEQNVREATRLGFLKIPENLVVDKRRAADIPPKQLCIIMAGAQGQTGSGLVRAAAGEHQLISFERGDKVVFSADPIPGNERNVYSLIDTLSRKGIEVSYSDVDDLLHVSGHASAGELKLLMALTKPKYLMPIGGTYRQMIRYRKLAEEMGYKEKDVFLLEDGQTLTFENGLARLGGTIQLRNIMIDGLGVGDVGPVVLRDRQTLAKDGVVILVMPVDKSLKKLAGKVEVISRGFVYMKESTELIGRVEITVEKTVNDLAGKGMEWGRMKDEVANRIEGLLYNETQRTPIVLPVIIEV